MDVQPSGLRHAHYKFHYHVGVCGYRRTLSMCTCLLVIISQQLWGQISPLVEVASFGIYASMVIFVDFILVVCSRLRHALCCHVERPACADFISPGLRHLVAQLLRVEAELLLCVLPAWRLWQALLQATLEPNSDSAKGCTFLCCLAPNASGSLIYF